MKHPHWPYIRAYGILLVGMFIFRLPTHLLADWIRIKLDAGAKVAIGADGALRALPPPPAWRVFAHTATSWLELALALLVGYLLFRFVLGTFFLPCFARVRQEPTEQHTAPLPSEGAPSE